MQKIKELWARLVRALKSSPKSTQSKAFVRVIQFFAVMLVLTIFARGTAGATMARVTAGSTRNNEIIQSIDTSGTVTAQGTVDIELPAGLTVSKILTPQGSTIKEGADILQFDLEAVEDELEKQEIQLRTLELELREMNLPKDTRDKTVESAQKSVDTAQKSYDKAQSAVNSAVQALENARSTHNDRYAAFEAARDALVAEEAKPAGEQDPALLESLKTAYDAAVQAQNESWEALETAEGAVPQANQDLESAADTLSDAKEALVDAREEAARNQQSQAITDDKNRLAIEQKETEIQKQQELIATLKAATGGEGRVAATADGIISQQPFEEGDVTGENRVIRITTASEGYIVECQVSQRDASSIKLGDNLTVKRSGFYYSTDAPVIGKTVPDAAGMVTLRASLPGSDWTAGDLLELQVVTSRQQYGSTVPLSAVHNDSQGDYVFVLREENTILGNQTVARRLDVSVLASDRTNAAIDGVWGEQVLLTSTKPVNDGDRVRIEGSES